MLRSIASVSVAGDSRRAVARIVPVLVDHPAGDLGATHVDPDSQPHQSSSHVVVTQVDLLHATVGAAPCDGSGTWVASRPAAACISEVAAVVRCCRTSGLVPRTAEITRQTGQ